MVLLIQTEVRSLEVRVIHVFFMAHLTDKKSASLYIYSLVHSTIIHQFINDLSKLYFDDHMTWSSISVFFFQYLILYQMLLKGSHWLEKGLFKLFLCCYHIWKVHWGIQSSPHYTHIMYMCVYSFMHKYTLWYEPSHQCKYQSYCSRAGTVWHTCTAYR